MSSWTCGCGAMNGESRFCEACGEERVGTASRASAPPKPALPAYREFPPRPDVRSSPGERCPEPSCPKTVKEHIAEFKAYGAALAQRQEFVGRTLAAAARDPEAPIGRIENDPRPTSEYMAERAERGRQMLEAYRKHIAKNYPEEAF